MQNILQDDILIIDDDLYFVTLYKKHLHNLGFTKIYHHSHDELDFLEGEDYPKIILISMHLKKASPLQLFNKIKSRQLGTCIILYSTKEDQYHATLMISEGAFDFIVKEKNDLEKITLSLQRLSLVKSFTDNPCSNTKPHVKNDLE